MRDNYYNDLNNFLDYSKRRQWQWQLFLNLITFVVTGLATFYVVNFSALNVRFNYSFASDKNKTQTTITTSTNTLTQSQDRQEDGATVSQPEVNVPMDMSDNSIYIAKIIAQAPITWHGTASNTQELLRRGVVHIDGSALPGEPGNVFLTGHSSDLPWSPGDYKTVFALLDKLENSDEIVIRYGGQNLLYKVYNKQVVKTDEVSNFITTDKAESITIMTCYPVGSNWKRLIVQAERVAL